MSVTIRVGAATDLTHTIENGMTVYVGDAIPRVSKYKTLAKDGVNLSVITLGSHTGTHVDAPAHFVKGGRTLDELPVEAFVGEAVVLDLSGLKAGSAIRASDLDSRGDEVRAGDIVLINTGYGMRWSDPRARRRYTYLAADAADWLVKKDVKAVGIDYLSVEKFGARKPVAHVTLLSHGIPIIESLNENIASIGRRVFFVCLPIKVGRCDGSPARAMAYQLGSDR
ncbi:MAG: cyclase family protein [Nitrososphaerota archaeon]|jgi:kynurenine formamidase|nr:cyclase family protein [Nitrososphaerota archaeon]MDG6942813.1 cyclase family protein [Nitrososphaerota archaeon]MDG6950867.1 cyclase family protein [Nitrososphaerota archaeon]